MSGERAGRWWNKVGDFGGPKGQQKPWCPPPTLLAGPRVLGACSLHGKQAREQWVPRERAGEA